MAWGAVRQIELEQLEAFWLQYADVPATDSIAGLRDRGTAAAWLDRSPELKCVADRFSADVLMAAAERARTIGSGANQVLIASGAITEDA